MIRVPPSILLSTRRSVWGNLERGSSRGYATARKWHLGAPTTRGIPPGVRTSKASAVLGAARVAPPARAVGFWGSAREQAAVVGGQSPVASPSEPIRAISQAIRANQRRAWRSLWQDAQHIVNHPRPPTRRLITRPAVHRRRSPGQWWWPRYPRLGIWSRPKRRRPA